MSNESGLEGQTSNYVEGLGEIGLVNFVFCDQWGIKLKWSEWVANQKEGTYINFLQTLVMVKHVVGDVLKRIFWELFESENKSVCWFFTWRVSRAVRWKNWSGYNSLILLSFSWGSVRTNLATAWEGHTWRCFNRVKEENLEPQDPSLLPFN